MRQIAELLRGLETLPIAEIQAEVLAESGNVLAGAVRTVLTVPPGGAHEAPWIESGTLHASIGADVDGDILVVGSTDPVALDQERGTRSVPPRPFLAPVAAGLGGQIAEAIGERFASLLKSLC